MSESLDKSISSANRLSGSRARTYRPV